MSIPGLLCYFLSSEYVEKASAIGVQTKYGKAIVFGFDLEGEVGRRLIYCLC